MTETSDTGEYLCGDCGADLLEDQFLSAVCGECGGFNPMTRQDYRNYADAVDARVGTPESDAARLVVSDGVEGAVLTDGDAWLQCKQPADTQANL